MDNRTEDNNEDVQLEGAELEGALIGFAAAFCIGVIIFLLNS